MHPDLSKPSDFIAITFAKIGVRVVEAPKPADAIEAVRHLDPVSYTRLTVAELNDFRVRGTLPVR